MIRSNESRFTNQGTSDVQHEGHSLAGNMPGAFPQSRTNTYKGANPTSTQIPDRTRDLNESSTTTGDRDHHYGRDAALAGGAAGLAGAA